MKKVTYYTTVAVGVLAMLAVLNPPQFLQDLIVAKVFRIRGKVILYSCKGLFSSFN